LSPSSRATIQRALGPTTAPLCSCILKTGQVQSSMSLQCLHLRASGAIAYHRAAGAQELGGGRVPSFCASNPFPSRGVSRGSGGQLVQAGKQGKVPRPKVHGITRDLAVDGERRRRSGRTRPSPVGPTSVVSVPARGAAGSARPLSSHRGPGPHTRFRRSRGNRRPRRFSSSSGNPSRSRSRRHRIRGSSR
jgi:hypothetical protein